MAIGVTPLVAPDFGPTQAEHLDAAWTAMDASIGLL